MKLPPIPFHFVRHGETDWNRQGKIQGWRDIPLNARGEAQAEGLRPEMAGYGFATIAVSPLARARRTAEILNADLKLETHVLDDLKEFDVGPLEGTRAETWIWDWLDGQTPPGVESFADFTVRVRRGLIHALALPGPVLVVAHGGLIWALEHLLGLPTGTDIANTTLVRFAPVGDRWQFDILTGDIEGAA